MATKKAPAKKSKKVERIKLSIQDFFFQNTTTQFEQEHGGVGPCRYGYWKPVSEAAIEALKSKGKDMLEDGRLGDFIHDWNMEII
jgi:hypothetical protein